MKKFSIFLALILGISIFAVTSCDTGDTTEQDFEKAAEEFVNDAEDALNEAENALNNIEL